MENFENESLSVKQWADEDRPREKLFSKGKSSLTDAELIAILLRSGSRDENVVDLSKKILNKVGNDLHALGKLSVQDILDFKLKGIGETKAITIVAALELGRRRKETLAVERPIISSSSAMFELMSPILSDERVEHFYVILLNRRRQLLDTVEVSMGGITGTVVDARSVFKPALQRNATDIILCHNHPSGNNRASNEDIKLTKQLIIAGNALNIQIVDHIIIADKQYFSFADEGILQ